MTDLAVIVGESISDRPLGDLEAVIERGLETFVDVGRALLEIRERRLYALTSGTFEDYCRERWGFSRQRASQLIQSSEVARILDRAPANAGQATELAPLLNQPETLREAWTEVQERAETEQRPVTAQLVREVVEEKQPRMVVPLNEELLERQQRVNLIASLDRAVYALESPPSAAVAEAERLLAGGDAGPFTPDRFERVIAYCRAFADALKGTA